MDRFLYSDADTTPIDEMLLAYMESRDDIAYPVIVPTPDGMRVMRNAEDMTAFLSPDITDLADEQAREQDESPVDLGGLFALQVEAALAGEYTLPDADIPDELWEEEATAAYIDNFNGKFPQAVDDEFGCLWQISSSMSLLDMFACYVDDTWGRGKDMDACWQVFAESCDLMDADKLVSRHLESFILPMLDEAGRVHNKGGVPDYDAGFIVRADGSDTLIADLADFTEHIVFTAEAASDLVPIFDFVSSWELFLRPTPTDLARALDKLPAYSQAGWGAYPYIAEKKDDESVQMRIANAYDLLYFTCDCDLEEWIDDTFPECPLLADMAAMYFDGLDIYRHY